MRQFIASSLPDKKGRIVLTEKEKRYLVSVLRIKHNDEIEVRLPNGILCPMQIWFSKNESKKIVRVELAMITHALESKEQSNNTVFCGNDYWLFQVLPKGQKMDIIVRQATECGVSAIIPIIGEYSIVGKARNTFKENVAKLERWTRIVREAQQQSGSPVATKIFAPCTLDEAIEAWMVGIKEADKTGYGFLLCEKQENHENLFSIIHKKNNIENARIGFVVGCEGGISPCERSTLQARGFEPMHLKTNILRAETAALYGLAMLQTVVGECTVWKGLNE